MPADQLAHETVPLLGMIWLIGAMGALDRHLLDLLMRRQSVSQPASSERLGWSPRHDESRSCSGWGSAVARFVTQDRRDCEHYPKL